MPITKQPKKSEPLWKEWDYKAQKKGVHHTVYSVNGDRYTGEWDDNKKNGKLDQRSNSVRILCNIFFKEMLS